MHPKCSELIELYTHSQIVTDPFIHVNELNKDVMAAELRIQMNMMPSNDWDRVMDRIASGDVDTFSRSSADILGAIYAFEKAFELHKQNEESTKKGNKRRLFKGIP